MKHVIAFDVSMGKSYMVIYNAQKQCVFESEIKHSKPEFEKLQEKIHELADNTGELPEIVFESTGIYSRQLERFMQDNQYTYCLLNPLEAKLQCDSLRIHKTDRSDAHRLALTHFTVTRRVSNGTINSFHQLKSLSRWYSELDSELSIIRGRMHKVIQLTFPELERMFTSKSDLFLNFVQLFPHPDCVLDLSKTIIKNRIRANTNKKISNITAEKKAIQIIEIAKTSYPAVSQNDVLCDQLKLYARRYQELLHQKECCINKMVYIAEQRAEYGIILSLPGIGPNTAVRLMAEIGDITRFNNNKQLNAFAGIDIRRFQSGKTFYKDKINKRGNKHLRKLLFLIIQNMIKQRRYGQNHIVEYYDKLKTQPYNKCHKVASIACVNKFLKLLFHLITHDIHYDYRLTA
ncbi:MULTISPECIES: IS110 family transposase [Bacillus cereus group]|nr:IS110 family transposase [Bacillus thuringiensis]AZR75380.1 IS110 family transposase [Bacillus thuringiensis]AZR75464.1 IS110 family transposase [Bacillus thuringiensis]AZR76861.1 IS110 family transposase [Bacillus thuringiensis]AZR77281.1 IS110 family transposase [Bacillus thuringiensis]AZR77505.1 IS110 family transposase [Bacillus thuringiensis]